MCTQICHDINTQNACVWSKPLDNTYDEAYHKTMPRQVFKQINVQHLCNQLKEGESKVNN